MDALEQARRTLSCVPPGEFTAVRRELVAGARDSGDRALAAAIGALRKPTQSAWAVNLLARERSSHVQDYLDLGRVLRARASDLTAQELRDANAERVASVRELVADARRLAHEHGVALSSTHASEVEQTLAAGFSDDDAADEVSAGTLTTALQYAGLGFGGAVTARRSVAPAPTAPPVPRERRTTDEVVAASRRRAALAAAVGAVDRAQESLDRLTRDAQDAEQELAAAQLRVATAERDLQHATAEEQRAEHHVDATVGARDAAQANLAELQQRLAELDPD